MNPAGSRVCVGALRPRVTRFHRKDSPVNVVGLDHLQVAIPPETEETARAFYVGVLGLEEIPKPQSLLESGGAWFRVGQVELHLGVELDFIPARKAHPGFRVTDVEVAAAECMAAGLHIQWDARYPGVRRFYVTDPFGNRLEILQPAKLQATPSRYSDEG